MTTESMAQFSCQYREKLKVVLVDGGGDFVAYWL